jgi:hypothetical protein
MKRKRGTVKRVGIGNADVMIGSVLYRSVPVGGLDYKSLNPGDTVLLSWVGEKPSIQGLHEYREDASGTPASVATATTASGSTTVIQTRVETLNLVDASGGIAEPDSNSQILMQSGPGITPTASGSRVTFSHSTGDIGDVHPNYTEHDQQEAVTEVWNFCSKLLVSDSSALTSTSPWAVAEVRSSDTTHLRLSYDAGNYAELSAAVDGSLTLSPGGTAVHVTENLIVDKDTGLGTSSPRRALDVLDNAAPQIRLTHTDNSVYTDLKTTEDGYFLIEPSGGRMQLDLDLEFIGSQSITTSLDDLTIAPAGDLLLNPGGAQIKVNDGDTLQAESFASQTTGWGISGAGSADFRYIYTDELHAKAFITDIEQALAGGQIISKSVAVVAADFTVPAAGGTQTLWVEDLPGAPDRAVFQAGDMIRLRQFSRDAGSLSITDCWGVVTNYSDGTDANEGTQSWTFTRSTGARAGAATGGSTIAARSLALDYGTSGNGFYEVNAIDGLWAANSPYFQVVTWATHPYDGKTVRLRGGNLKGVTAEEEYGLFSGNGLTTTSRYLRLSDQHTELHNLPLTFHDGTNTRIKLEPLVSSGGPYISVGNTAPSSYLGGDGFWVGNDSGTYKAFLGDADGERMQWDGDEFGIYAATGDPLFITGPAGNWMSSLMVSESMGQWIFSQNNGLALWGPGCEISPTAWVSTRGQVATISGAFHQEQGRWAGTRGLVIDTASTNTCTNPSFEANATGWTASSLGSIARTTEQAKFGSVSLKCTSGGGQDFAQACYTGVTLDPSRTYWVSGHYKLGTIPPGGNVVLRAYFSGGANPAAAREVVGGIASPGGWIRVMAPLQADYPDRTGVLFYLGVYGATADGQTMYIDGFQVESFTSNDRCTTYMDGDLDWCYWTGTPHASNSNRGANPTNVVVPASESLNPAAGSLVLNFKLLNPPGLTASFWLFAAGNANAIFDAYVSYLTKKIRLRINNQLTLEGTTVIQPFEEYQVVFTWDVAANKAQIYLNGALEAEGACPAWTMGTSLWLGGTFASTTLRLHGTLSQAATTGRVLTADEVAAMYATSKPLVDAGSTSAPGIYILDGKFSIASSTSGNRLEMNSTRLAIGNGISYGGVGCWMGLDGGTTPKLSLYADANNYLLWNGANLSWKGANTSLSAAGALTCTSGSIGGWTLDANKLYNGSNIGLDGANKSLWIEDSAAGTAGHLAGIRLWYDGSHSQFYAGASANEYMKFDGSKIEILTGGGALRFNNAGFQFAVDSGEPGIVWRSTFGAGPVDKAYIRYEETNDLLRVVSGGTSEAAYRPIVFQQVKYLDDQVPLYISGSARSVSLFDTSPQAATLYVCNPGDSHPAAWFYQPESAACVRLQTAGAANSILAFNFNCSTGDPAGQDYNTLRVWIEGVGAKYIRLYDSSS